MMAEHVYRKFPNHIEAIQTLLQKDATFREICADYEEMCKWLACQNQSEGQSKKGCDIAREVIRELEDEITKALRSAGL
jgi:uncharacterized protein YdcH (DUF465 family)